MSMHEMMTSACACACTFRIGNICKGCLPSILFKSKLDLRVDHRFVANICVILRLGGELVLNECFYHLYSLIDSVSISNKK
jgi:hypothetical protein